MTEINMPHDLAPEQEQQMIGALLKDPSRLQMVREIIKPDDILLFSMRAAFIRMMSLQDNGFAIDTVTLGDELERHQELNDFSLGGRNGRIALACLRSEFRGDNAESYALKILDYSAKRKMIEEFNVGAGWLFNGRDATSIRNDMIRRLTDIKTPNAMLDQHTMTFKEALSKTWDATSNGRSNFVSTGLIDLDKMFYGGLMAPDFTIVAGRPGDGKTALLLTIAKYAAEKAGKRVLLFSLEMSNEQVTMRMISMETGILYGDMVRGVMSKENWEKFNQAIEDMEGSEIHLNDMPSVTINQIRQKHREIEAKYGRIDLVIVDYLQLQGSDDEYGNREQEVSAVSRGLKAIAKEFDVPVLAAAQLSRAGDKRQEKKPVLSDLRESGGLEQDADNVLFIYTPDAIKPNNKDIIIAKHRNGAVGKIGLYFKSQYTRFENSYLTRMSASNEQRGE